MFSAFSAAVAAEGCTSLIKKSYIVRLLGKSSHTTLRIEPVNWTQDFFQDQYGNISETKLFKKDTETFVLRNIPKPRQNCLKLKLRPNFPKPQKIGKSVETKKSRDRNVTLCCRDLIEMTLAKEDANSRVAGGVGDVFFWQHYNRLETY